MLEPGNCVALQYTSNGILELCEGLGGPPAVLADTVDDCGNVPTILKRFGLVPLNDVLNSDKFLVAIFFPLKYLYCYNLKI
jgi:hypothetical protein